MWNEKNNGPILEVICWVVKPFKGDSNSPLVKIHDHWTLT